MFVCFSSSESTNFSSGPRMINLDFLFYKPSYNNYITLCIFLVETLEPMSVTKFVSVQIMPLTHIFCVIHFIKGK